VQDERPQISAKTLVDTPILAILRHRRRRPTHPRHLVRQPRLLPLLPHPPLSLPTRLHRLEPKSAYRSRRHTHQIPLRKPPIQPNDLYPRLPRGRDSERQQGIAGFMPGPVWEAAEGRVQEEVLHVDDDEGCFAWVDGDGGCGCAEVETGGYGGGEWGWRVGEVEAVVGAVEPEVGGVAEGGVVGGGGGGERGGGEGGKGGGGGGRGGGGHGWWGGTVGDDGPVLRRGRKGGRR